MPDELQISSIPGCQDLADDTIEAYKYLRDDSLVKISHNAKFAAVRSERIFMGYFKHGDVIGVPYSPVDGYKYSRAEVLYDFALYSTRSPDTSFVSGQATVPTIFKSQSDNIYWFRSDVDDTSGQATIEVSYFRNGGQEVVTHDGVIKVYANCQRQSVNSPQPEYFEFSLTQTPLSHDIRRGNSYNFDINVIPEGGFNENVSLSIVSTLPTGVAATLTPGTVIGGSGTSVLHVTIGSTTPLGIFTITIQGSNGFLIRSTSIYVNVTAALWSAATSMSQDGGGIITWTSGDWTATVVSDGSNPIYAYSGVASGDVPPGGMTDQAAQFTWRDDAWNTSGDGGNGGPGVNLTAGGNGYLASLVNQYGNPASTQRLKLYRVSAGVPTNVAQATLPDNPVTPNGYLISGTVVRIESHVSGSDVIVTVSWGGTVYITYTDTSGFLGGAPGVRPGSHAGIHTQFDTWGGFQL